MYALITAGFFLTIGGATITTKNTISFVTFKIIPVAIGVWCLWESALLVLAEKV